MAVHQRAELVAAQPRDERAGVGLRGRLERPRRLAEREVAGVVPVAVVDALQPVEVAEQQRQLPARCEPGGHRLVQAVVQRAAVRQAGERVLEGERLEPGEELGPPDGRRDLPAQRLDEAQVVGGERRAPALREGVEPAPHAALDQDRRRDHRALAEPLQHRRVVAGQVRVVQRRRRRGGPRLTSRAARPVGGASPRPSTAAGAAPSAPRTRARASPPASARAAPSAGARVPAVDGDARGAQDGERLLADDLEHVLEPVRGGHGAGHRDQRAQLGLQRAVGAHLGELRRWRRRPAPRPAGPRGGRGRAGAPRPSPGRTGCPCGARSPRAPRRWSARAGTGGRTSWRATRRR